MAWGRRMIALGPFGEVQVEDTLVLARYASGRQLARSHRLANGSLTYRGVVVRFSLNLATGSKMRPVADAGA